MSGSGSAGLCLTLVLTASGLAAQEPGAQLAADEAPAVVAFTLDSSGSLRPRDIETTRRLAREVLGALPVGSRVAVLSFDDQSRLLLEATDDLAAVEQALAGVRIAGRYTALHDALFDASRYLVERDEPRRAIVLVTDGKDENSAVLLEDGLAIAREEQIPVFAIGVGRIQEPVLRRIAKLTGGDYVPAADADGSALASQIRTLAPRGAPAPPTTSAPPPAPATPAPAARPASPRRLLLWGALGLGLVLAVLAGILAMKGRRQAHTSGFDRAARRPDAAREAPADADATILARSPIGGGAGQTVVLSAAPVLRITQGPGAGGVFPLSSSSPVSVGRSPANDVVLEDDAASGQHCRVRCENERFVLYDLESTNGTFVNDKRVGRHPLSEGDVIRVGETLLEYRAFGKRG